MPDIFLIFVCHKHSLLTANSNQCELNRRLLHAGFRTFSNSTIHSLIKSIETCRVLRRHESQVQARVSAGPSISAPESRPQTNLENRAEAEPRRPAWVNWVTSEFLFHGRYFVMHPQPELPFASVALGSSLSEIIFVATSPNRRLTAACDSSGKIALLTNGLEYTTTLRLHQRAVTCCDFSPDSAFLAAASDDCTVSVWSVTDKLSGRVVGRCLRIMKHDGAARLCRYDPTRQFLCTSGGDGVAFMWYIPCWTNDFNLPRGGAVEQQPIREHCRETASCAQTIEGHTAYLSACCWSGRGDIFVTGSFDQTIRIHARAVSSGLWHCTESLKFSAPVAQCDFDSYDSVLVLSFIRHQSLLVYDVRLKTTIALGEAVREKSKYCMHDFFHGCFSLILTFSATETTRCCAVASIGNWVG